MVVFVLGMVFGPLLVFTGELALAKRTGLREYGTLAERYVRESMPNGCAVVRLLMSRSLGALTSSHSLILGSATRWCGPCVSRP